MKQFYSFLLLCAATCCGIANASAQMVGGNAFLQGAYLEIGVDNMGALGACGTPAGYHPHIFGASNLAEVYDYGHDGWTVGSPAYMGDYTIPGVPSEGWSIQIGATEYRNWATSTACTGPFNAPGTITGYSNTGGNKIGTWTGAAAGVSIVQEARVDTLASAVVFTVKIQNTNPTPTGAVYYERMCDPDNTSSWSTPISGGPTTVNLIEHQNEDLQHHVVVSATGTTYAGSGYTPLPYTYLAYGTKDCRAKAGILTSGLYPSNTPAQLWAGTGIQTTLGYTNTSDVCIVLLYNLGPLAAAGSPGDRTVVSYAMFFNGASGIDSAFPNPQLVVNGTAMTSSPPPIADKDTLNTCGLGLTTVPALLLNADDRNWSLSTWTWSPSIGLASTTGTTNTIDVTSIPNYTTYTITGTDSATGMNSCLRKTFYLTIVTCGMYATSNNPCVGDSLKFVCHGDSTGATYAWSGPSPSTTVFSTIQSPVIYPSTMANAGLYRVIRTVGATIDTAYVNVVINPIPTIGGVLGVCTTGSTSLTATPPGGAWTSSTTTVATVNATTGLVQAVSNGTTTISYTSAAGCKTNVVVTVDTLANITGTMVMCQGYSTTLHHAIAGGTWNTSATNVSVGSTSGIVTGISAGTATVTYHTTADCYKTAVVTVNPTPMAIGGTNEVCQYFTTTLADGSPGGTWSSSNTAVGTISSAGGVLYGVSGGTTTITYTLPTTCYITKVATVHPKPAPPTVTPVSYCQFNIPVPVSAGGINLTWYGPGVTAAYTMAATPSTATPGVTAYYVTQTSAFGCVSDSSMLPVTVIAKPVPPIVHDTMFCQYSTPPALTADGSNLKWYTGSGTPLASAPVPPTTFPGATTWQVTQSVNGCESDMVPITVTIIFKPDFNIAASSLKVCQFDSLTFRYSGPALIDPTYVWDIPSGASVIAGSIYDTMITVRFDSAVGPHVVYLTAANLGGRCATTVPAVVKVIPRPAGFAELGRDICIYDTITMALASRTDNAFDFAWFVDNESLFTTHKVNIITASSSHGGPYKITFNDTGRHVVKITSFTDANSGCPSQPTMDTVNVHGLPDPAFSIKQLRKQLCLEDSMWFEAATIKYNNNYHWSPDQFFPFNDAPGLFGKMNQDRSTITLTVTDPFGCKNSSMQDFFPETCCSVFMPTAFTPNGDGKNDHYGPVCAGFHRYHTFRITNRWGQTLFESTNSEPTWDGTYNGIPQDMGVYFYYIKFDCGGKTVETKGDFTLVR